MQELTICSINQFANLRSFPGTKIKRFSYHAVASLAEESRNRILIHRGCNGISNKTSTPENIAKDLFELAKTCRRYEVNDIFISSFICRRYKFVNEKV